MDDIQNSMEELTMRLSETGEQVAQLTEIFGKANEAMGKSVDTAILEKLDQVIGQNEKIASAILALADMLKESGRGSEEIPIPPQRPAQMPQFREQPPQEEQDDFSDLNMPQAPRPQWTQQRQQRPGPAPMQQMPPMQQPMQMQPMSQFQGMPPPPQAMPQQSYQQQPYQQQQPQRPDDDLKPLPLFQPKRGMKEELRSQDAPPIPRNPMPRPGMY